MEHFDLQAFLMWGTLINFAILIVASVGMFVSGSFAAKLHRQVCNISEQQVYFGSYLILGVYKILILLFFFVPWLIVSLVI